MAIKHVVTRMLDPESIVTHGLNYIGPSFVAMVNHANQLVGDHMNDEMYYKGVPVTGFTFALINASTGAAITSGTVTEKITQDGGTQANVSASAAHEGNGQWSINLTAAEMNADIVSLIFTHSSAVPAYITINTT